MLVCGKSAVCAGFSVGACGAFKARCGRATTDIYTLFPQPRTAPLGLWVVRLFQGVGLRLLIAWVAGSGPTACAPKPRRSPGGRWC